MRPSSPPSQAAAMGAIGVHPAASRTGDHRQHVATLTYTHDEMEAGAAAAEPGAALRAKLTVAYAAQLELVGGLCHWAVYVALHLADAGARTKLVRTRVYFAEPVHVTK